MDDPDMFFEQYIRSSDDLEKHSDQDLKELFDGISFKCVDSYGGEGEGSTYYSIYSFTNKMSEETLYVKFDGYYASYVGSEFHDWFYVEPKEEVVINYYPVK